VCSSDLLIAVNGMTEPASGSDAFAMLTNAVQDGDGFRLNGTKTFSSNGPVADLALIYAVTDPASNTVAAVTLGATITDGMGAGGRNSTFGQDSAIVQAAPGGTAAITLEALYLAYSRDYVKIYVDTDKEPLVTLSGTALPPLAEGSRTYRSKVGGYVQVRTYRDNGEPGHAGFFSFRVLCVDDAGCGHGTCDTATGACSCQ
jgi:hypothetical protein